mmetsp:Transcript_36125/g.114868  ORF Transcript_36125/g.114868 Transcript_36125/m.114868 type:complete len:214 (+) Transcript_36125:140-781(+)
MAVQALVQALLADLLGRGVGDTREEGRKLLAPQAHGVEVRDEHRAAVLARHEHRGHAAAVAELRGGHLEEGLGARGAREHHELQPRRAVERAAGVLALAPELAVEGPQDGGHQELAELEPLGLLQHQADVAVALVFDLREPLQQPGLLHVLRRRAEVQVLRGQLRLEVPQRAVVGAVDQRPRGRQALEVPQEVCVHDLLARPERPRGVVLLQV